ncbi:MAG: class I SAM-dependent methyltransferase [Sedimentisphaerales bacterium]|nr:class I SAM-dependent methyltransferase [Sedimentisphaerales bacterium]
MLSKTLNFIFLPLRIVCSHEFVNKLGLRSIRDERCDYVMNNCRGRLLDIGCGNNQLVGNYGHDSIGVDVYDFGGGAVIVQDTSKLPFADGSFDSVSFVASLNHIPNRREVLAEVRRLLSDNGRVVLTMISPFIGAVRHKLAWWDEDQSERGLKQGEQFGMTHKHIISLFESEGFRLLARKRIICRLNNLYVFEKVHKEFSKVK